MEYHFYLPLFVILFMTALIPFLFHLSHLLGKTSNTSEAKNEVYESGIRNTYHDSFERFNVKYYLVGIIFIIFDVETLFMFPWALNLRELSLFGLLEMFSFMAILLVGLIYVYRSKALVWK